MILIVVWWMLIYRLIKCIYFDSHWGSMAYLLALLISNVGD